MNYNITIRKAVRDDVPEIVRLFQEGRINVKQENNAYEIIQGYYDALDAINNDANNLLIIAEIEGRTVGTLQITYVTNMSYGGAKRAYIEGVHVDKSLRSQGIGQYMMEWAISQAKERGCRFVQLTSHKHRKDAHRFYERVGFTATHEGFKLDLGS